jgi:hypothetical protein
MALMLIGPVEAARYLGCSLQALQYRASVRQIRVARRKPTLKFRVEDVLEHARTAPPVRHYTRRRPAPTALEIFDDRLQKLLKNTKG